jgi:sugar phosphate isomerase/epimerase
MWAKLTEISGQVDWYGQKLSPEDWKDMFTASLRKARVVPGLDAGSFVPLGMRTSDMTKDEMSDLLELISAFAAERGVVFSDDERELA